MDRSEEIASAVGEIRDLLREGRKSQVEALELLRANAERTKSVIDRSVALQEVAVRRQKKILALVLPLIVVCLAAIGYLLLKLRF
jgi:CHASE3 domain sensor protein